MDKLRWAFALLVMCLAGCSTVRVTDYSGLEPRMDLEAFFQGELTAHGVVKNRAGRVIRTFNADIIATWEDGVGELDEKFLFNDGSRDRRRWVLTPSGDQLYKATAGDVVGEKAHTCRLFRNRRVFRQTES